LGEYNLHKTRIISGLIGILLLLIVVYSNETVLGVSIFILSLIGIHEYYNAIAMAGYKPLKIAGYITCLPILLLSFNIRFYENSNILAFIIFIGILFLFSAIIFAHKKFNIVDIALTVFGVLYIPFLFSFIILVRDLKYGIFLIWLIFIGAFVTDTAAYFSGRYFGKTKLLPAISPKKTLEGSIGGILGTMAVTCLYGVYLLNGNHITSIPFYNFVIIGALNGVISQIGDWAASAIKRHVKVKDYGKFMPGHGGVLDRFDSILFTAPVVYFYITFLTRI
jgi:phosphatidate cytidylyltransferase